MEVIEQGIKRLEPNCVYKCREETILLCHLVRSPGGHYGNLSGASDSKQSEGLAPSTYAGPG